MSKVYVISSSDSEEEVPSQLSQKMGCRSQTCAKLFLPLQTGAMNKVSYDIPSSDEEDLPPSLYERVLLSLSTNQSQHKTNISTTASSTLVLPSFKNQTIDREVSEFTKAKSSLRESACLAVQSNFEIDLQSVCQSEPVENSIVISSDDDDDCGGDKVNLLSYQGDIPVINNKYPEDEDVDLLPALDVLSQHTCNGKSSSASSQDSQLTNGLAQPSKKRKTTKNASEEIHVQREEKRKQREAKLAAAQREKILKQIQREEQQSQKPGECIKFVKVILDVALLEMPDAVDLPRILRESNIQYSIVEQPLHCSVTWKRQIIQQAISEDLQVEKLEKEEEETQAIVVLTAKQFVEAVHNFKMYQFGSGHGDTLVDIVRRQKAALPGKQLTVFICGISKYFQKQKSRKQREYRGNILDGESQPATQSRPKKTKTSDRDIPYEISRVDIEEAIIDLQIREPCNVRLIDSSTEMAYVIAAFTKSIAEAPLKRIKDNSGTFSWFADGDTRQSVKVNQDGSGLLALWQKQIEQFSQVSADVAQAIVVEYSSPRELVRAYGRCRSKEECEQLLKDIVVRRGIGPLATTRRIGPELSRKIYVMLTSTNGDLVLDAY